MLDAQSIDDLRKLARRRLPRGMFEFVDCGVEDETGLSNNRDAFRRIALIPRVLKNVAELDASVELFGERLSFPAVIAPTGAAGLLWYEGDLAVARAAARAGIPFVLANPALAPMEDVARVTDGKFWFQVYPWAERTTTFETIDRAKAAGAAVLVVTVDTPVVPHRAHNIRNGFTIPYRLSSKSVLDVLRRPYWIGGVIFKYLQSGGLPQFANYPAKVRGNVASPIAGRSISFDASFDWEAFKALRDYWRGKLAIKGILHPEDARRAADIGVDAIVVSNHGARNLDCAVSPIEMLPEIAEATNSRVPVLIDGGIRRGSDIVKALALGASAVLLGRAPLYGVAAGGEAGAFRAIEILRNEYERVLAFAGCTGSADAGQCAVRLASEQARMNRHGAS